MNKAKAFVMGLGGQRVDYSTRHNNRWYDYGEAASCFMFVSLPFVACFGGGVVVGAWFW